VLHHTPVSCLKYASVWLNSMHSKRHSCQQQFRHLHHNHMLATRTLWNAPSGSALWSPAITNEEPAEQHTNSRTLADTCTWTDRLL
jgi:hypothetical protein